MSCLLNVLLDPLMFDDHFWSLFCIYIFTIVSSQLKVNVLRTLANVVAMLYQSYKHT